MDEPPNPYRAPTAALSDGTTATVPLPADQGPPRVAAVIVALFGFPIGAGLYLLGLRRQFVAWAAAGLLAGVLMIAAIRAPVPKLCPIGIVVLVALWLAAAVATMRAEPGPAPVKHAARWALLLIVVALGINAAVRHWLVEAFQMPSGSMIPTLLVGDHMFVKKGRADVARGDVIVFDFPSDPRTQYIKRVVAVGGDTVKVAGGIVSINGVELVQEPMDGTGCVAEESTGLGTERVNCRMARETNAGHSYTILLEPDRPAMDHPLSRIPEGEVFVLGDNRDNSYDSRKWGTVPLPLIRGKATVTWWSRATAGIRWSRVGHGIE